jgi:hypothetical protein
MEVAVLAGNPEKEGPWTLRLKLPENYVFPPHNIPVNETVTVLSGVIYIGLGDTFDRTKAQRMAVGSFVELPGKINRYSWNQTEVIVEVHSIGPSPITYANPAVTTPYFVLGMIGLLLCILSAKFLFHVPLRGSVLVLTGVSVLYLLVTLGTGLLISSVTKSQFIASQVAITGTFLPAMMLSGFLFDLRSMPAAIRTITYILPARYYVALLQTIFLAGDIWSVIVPNAAVLAAMAAGLLLLARVATQKKLA